MTDKTPPSETRNDLLIKQTLHALTHVKHDQRELLEGIKNTITDGQLPIHRPVIDKLTEIFCKAAREDIADAAANCVFEAAIHRNGENYLLQNMFTMTKHALETGNEETACKIINDVIFVLKKKMDWADLAINDQFQELKDVKIKPRPDETPVDALDRIKKKILKKASIIFNTKAAPENKLGHNLLKLQYAFDEILITQFNQAIDKNENSKGLIHKWKNKVRKFKNGVWF